MKKKSTSTFKQGKEATRDDIYFCLCCSQFKWSKDGSRVSDKYCMSCGQTGKKKSIRVIQVETSGLYCEECYNRLVESGELVPISEEEQKTIDAEIQKQREFFEHYGPIGFDYNPSDVPTVEVHRVPSFGDKKADKKKAKED